MENTVQEPEILYFSSRLHRRIFNHFLGTASVATDSSSTPSPTETPLYAVLTQASSRAHRRLRESVAMPGPLGFATSGYFMGVIFMAYLLNRVQNIVVPTRHATAQDRVRARQVHRQQLRAYRAASQRGGWRLWMIYARIFFKSCLPVDFSSTRSRVVFRMPSIYLLIKALLLWTVMVLQSAQLYPSNSSLGWINSWGQQVEARTMDDICWFSFLAASFSLFISALTNGLEGVHASPHTPFNLFGYAFILYVYSSPVTHTVGVKGAPSRPDTHVLITMTIPLLQLSMTHILEAHKRYARARLVPTAIAQTLSLVHFHSVTLIPYFFPSLRKVDPRSTRSYPLPTVVPSVVETFLMFIILTTISLNALTQLLTTGTVRGPLISMIGHAGTLAPRWDEDFGIALFRLGTASLEATCVKGFGNEVGSISVGHADFAPAQNTSRLWSRGQQALAMKAQTEAEANGGTVEITRSGVVSVYQAEVGDTGGSRRTLHGRIKRGFWNEIKHVKASSRQTDRWADSVLNVPWYRSLGKFALQIWILTKSLFWAVKKWTRGQRSDQVGDEEDETDNIRLRNSHGRSVEGDDDEADGGVYERFLRGDDMGGEDDDDLDFDPNQDVFREDLDTDEDSEDENEADEDDTAVGVTTDTFGLYADLSQDASSSSTPASVLLAHLTSSSPLTRRRYSSLLHSTTSPSVVSVSTASDDFETSALEIRHQKLLARSQLERSEDNDAEDERRRTCVICTVEPRQIICWPCRCLALCDDCRENMASRSAASKHMCPCCRRYVEGFSRIYIP